MPRNGAPRVVCLVIGAAASSLALAPSSKLFAAVTMRGEVSRILGPAFSTPAHLVGLSCSQGIQIGVVGRGGMDIDGGSHVDSGEARVNRASRVTIEGSGSSWRVCGKLGVGYSGSGVLDITAGGRVSSTGGYIAGSSLSAGTGRVVVRGTGSAWACHGTLRIGANGSGLLSIGRGGSVIVSGNLNIGDANSDGTVRLNGGTLDMQNHDITTGSGLAAFTFTGGTLQGVRAFAVKWDQRLDLRQLAGTLATTKRMVMGGNYVLGAPGTLRVILSGADAVQGADLAQYDVKGNAALAGRLQVVCRDGFKPRPGQRFDVLKAANIDAHGLRVSGFGFRIIDNGHVLELIEPTGSLNYAWLLVVAAGLTACLLAAGARLALFLRRRRSRCCDVTR